MPEAVDYIVKDIQGDYCILANESGEEKPVAMFFLSPDINIGQHVRYENMQYTIL